MDDQNPPINPAPPVQNQPIQDSSSSQSQSTQSKPSIPPELGISNKIILLVIGVLVLILAGGGTYLALNSKSKIQPIVSKESPISTPSPTPTSVPTPAPDETANWKTYTNINYHYSLKIPQDTKILAEEKNLEGKGLDYFEGELAHNVVLQYSLVKEEELLGKTDEEAFKYALKQGALTINIEVIKGVKSDFAKYAEKGGKLLGNPVGGSTIEKIEIGGTQAYKVTYPNRPNATDYYIENIKDQVIIYINENRFIDALDTPDKSDELFKLFDQILSTFKFTQ